jgi:hypothetical protein
MTTDAAPEPGAAPACEALQFDHADFTTAPASMICSACRQPIRNAYYEIQGKVFCADCRDRVVARFAGGFELAPFLRAALFGAGAALAGAAVYVVVLLVTHYNIGLLAILVGYMVGLAIRKGAQFRGGVPYQLLAVFLTYTAVVCWPVPLIVGFSMMGGKPIGTSLVQLIAQAYASPFLSGGKNIMGLVIIGFALLQAWRMNPKVTLPISGPFQVSGGRPPYQEAPAHA